MGALTREAPGGAKKVFGRFQNVTKLVLDLSDVGSQLTLNDNIAGTPTLINQGDHLELKLAASSGAGLAAAAPNDVLNFTPASGIHARFVLDTGTGAAGLDDSGDLLYAGLFTAIASGTDTDALTNVVALKIDHEGKFYIDTDDGTTDATTEITGLTFTAGTSIVVDVVVERLDPAFTATRQAYIYIDGEMVAKASVNALSGDLQPAVILERANNAEQTTAKIYEFYCTEMTESAN